jgi:hypothetical protein
MSIAIALAIAVSIVRPSETACESLGITIPQDKSTASAAETESWLKTSVPELARYTLAGIGVEDRFKWVDLSQCHLQWNQGFDWRKLDAPQPNLVVGHTYKLALKDLDPASFEIHADDRTRLAGTPGRWGWMLFMKARGDSSLIACTEQTVSIANQSVLQNHAMIFFPDRESAERVGRAVKHAAILCGAKVAPF